MSSSTIVGPKFCGGNDSDRATGRAEESSAAVNGGLSRMGAGQATSSDRSHTDRSKPCRWIGQEIGYLIERRFEEQLCRCARPLAKGKNQWMRLSKKATKTAVA